MSDCEMKEKLVWIIGQTNITHRNISITLFLIWLKWRVQSWKHTGILLWNFHARTQRL